MSYKVIRSFYDKNDNNRGYNIGDTYPRKGLDVSEERIERLASNNNNIGVPLIEKIADNKAEIKHEEKVITLDNGERVSQPKWKKK